MGDARITLAFLKSLFKTADPKICVDSYEESTGSGRGDNYTSSLFRINVKGHLIYENQVAIIEPWETSIIYKCLPENSIRREAYKSEKLFKNEEAFYTRIIPLFQKFQDDHNVDETRFDAIPKCYWAKDGLIILEDLKAKGYQMADRKKGLNFLQITAVVEELAKYHAISLAMKIKEPNAFYPLMNEDDGISEGLFVEENEEWYREYYKHTIKNVLELIEKHFEKDDRKDLYIERFSKFADDKFFDKMISMIREGSPLNVLCHGDCWTNNIMFKTTKENGLQVCFIDFQLCRYGSLALDLANLIYCCTTRKLRDENLSTLLEKYQISLSNSIAALLKGCPYENHELADNDNLKELILHEFKRCALFGLGLAIDMIPISTCDSEEAPDMYESEEFEEVDFPPVPVANELCSVKMGNLISELVDHDIL